MIKKRLFLSLAITLIFNLCGCAPVQQENIENPPSLVNEIIFDETWLDMDGDGIEEYIRLSSGMSETADGYCLTPLLTVHKGEEIVAMRQLFESVGYVKPFFGEQTDLNGDACIDIHVLYEPKNPVSPKEFCVLTLQDGTVVELSPENAYLAVLYEVPEYKDALDKWEQKLESLTDALYSISTSIENSVPLHTRYISIRFEGPLEIKTIDNADNDDLFELRYLLTAYSLDGWVNAFDIWINQYDDMCWKITDMLPTGTRHISVINDIAAATFLYARPGERLDSNLFAAYSEVTAVAGNRFKRYYTANNIADGTGATAYDIDAVTRYLISATLYNDAIPTVSHLVDSALSQFSKGESIADVKSVLGDAPYLESEDTLVYLRTVYCLDEQWRALANHATAQIPGFETLYFTDGKLDSIEISIGTDYQIAVTPCEGDFEGYTDELRDKSVDKAMYYNICGYKTYTWGSSPSCICIYPRDHIENGNMLYCAGKNIKALYQGSQRVDCEYLSAAFITSYGNDISSVAAIDYQLLPRIAYDYDADGRHEIVALAIFPTGVYPVMYDTNMNGVFLLDDGSVDAFCTYMGNDKLREDLERLTIDLCID